MSLPSLTSYGGLQHEAGYAGGMVDMNFANIENYTNDQAATIDYGVAVAQSGNDQLSGIKSCKAPAADGDVIVGISVRYPVKAIAYTGAGANTIAYAQGETLPVCRHGVIFVIAAENVTRMDKALSLTASGGTIGGTTGGAAGAGRVTIPNAVWQTTTAAGQLGIVRIIN